MEHLANDRTTTDAEHGFSHVVQLLPLNRRRKGTQEGFLFLPQLADGFGLTSEPSPLLLLAVGTQVGIQFGVGGDLG